MKNKALSGRYFLTIACGVAFLYATYKGTLSPEAITGIITMVFVSYFERKDRTNGGA